MIEEFLNLFGRKRRAFLFGMAGLAAGRPGAGISSAFRAGWLDEVRGRRLGGSGGVLACRGQLLLQVQDPGLQVGDLLA